MSTNDIQIETVYKLPLEEENPFGKDTINDLNVLLSVCTKYLNNPNIELLTRAYYYCVDSHKNVLRSSGEPYYTHPLKVAISLMKDFSVQDNASVIGALLHDTIEELRSRVLQQGKWIRQLLTESFFLHL